MQENCKDVDAEFKVALGGKWRGRQRDHVSPFGLDNKGVKTMDWSRAAAITTVY